MKSIKILILIFSFTMVSVDSDLVDNTSNKTKYHSDNTTITPNSFADNVYDAEAVTTPITPVAAAPSTSLSSTETALPPSLVAAASLILRDKRELDLTNYKFDESDISRQNKITQQILLSFLKSRESTAPPVTQPPTPPIVLVPQPVPENTSEQTVTPAAAAPSEAPATPSPTTTTTTATTTTTTTTEKPHRGRSRSRGRQQTTLRSKYGSKRGGSRSNLRCIMYEDGSSEDDYDDDDYEPPTPSTTVRSLLRQPHQRQQAQTQRSQQPAPRTFSNRAKNSRTTANPKKPLHYRNPLLKKQQELQQNKITKLTPRSRLQPQSRTSTTITTTQTQTPSTLRSKPRLPVRSRLGGKTTSTTTTTTTEAPPPTQPSHRSKFRSRRLRDRSSFYVKHTGDDEDEIYQDGREALQSVESEQYDHYYSSFDNISDIFRRDPSENEVVESSGGK